MNCCEGCIHFRRREDGLPLCLAVMLDADERAARDRALKGTNALNRCTRFVPLADTNKPSRGD
ncbi:hypothetical protein [Cupriavidus pinatubonensis]|uniref:hypothetical protein n=1 Tax=Cupriavidus pinatubonensis TaxID=248026 RepID=UPI001128F2ED|nr:hypothetical protein [Cupriavidus pinatubonensis]TPQ35716.1 hypothetical protein C2U69_20480 [Cupriavidus pinatubonensis]